MRRPFGWIWHKSGLKKPNLAQFGGLIVCRMGLSRWKMKEWLFWGFGIHRLISS